ncbi:sigma 54-interacting transcriptional regulator [Desulfoluna spongiiphila]|uniref:PAS domain S-box-containing protein n=1 Tax=Desulfoluna spongiiphila TaxID=419481 RepID=A0A1G5FVV0_9BACT|nr:sigma 54-interacting transcriptional regulator [Desulfoluna spongiiphila]SCY43366.1 PAS domain S-box-containing protein [Desulfoluna spongiiphila]
MITSVDVSKNDLMRELGKMNRFIKILSRCKKAFIHEKDEKNLLNEICRIIVEVGSFPFVWIGFAQAGAKKTILPVATCGYEEGYLRAIAPTWGESADNPSPMDTAIRSGTVCTIPDIRATDTASTWQYEAILRGFGSVVAFPLISDGNTLGAISIYAGDAHAFDPEKVDLLRELANDITCGVLNLRSQLEGSHIKGMLKETEAKYSGVLENTGTGTILIETDGMISFANATFETYSGYSAEELIDRMKWSDVIHADDRPRLSRYHVWRRTEPGRAPDVYECKMITKTRTVKNMLMKVGMVKGTQISIASFMDITHAKLAEDRLKQRESQLRAIIENFDGMIYIRDMDHRIEFMNTPLIEFLGGDAIGKRCHSVIYGLNTPCPWCRSRSLLKGDPIKKVLKCPKNDRWYDSVISPIHGSDGSVSRIQAIIRDITEQKMAEEALLEREKGLRQENLRLKSTMKDRYKFGDIVGKSQAMQTVYELILKSAASDDHIIIYGESGTGKELVAKAIHDASGRSAQNFVPVNCGAINENIIESEFFGHKKGAFTGADRDHEGFLDKADGGTLFLDEIGEIGLNMQVKLLRAIDGGGFTPVGSNEVKKPDIRIVSATNRNLVEHVKNNRMREDFFYRIHVIPIYLKPLRERKEDLPLLIEHFLKRFCPTTKVPPVTGKFLEAITHYDWPGNVRELQNALRRFISLKELNFSSGITPAFSPLDQAPTGAPDEFTDLKTVMNTFEKQVLTDILQKCHWHRERAAAMLKIHRKTLFGKMKKYDLMV